MIFYLTQLLLLKVKKQKIILLFYFFTFTTIFSFSLVAQEVCIPLKADKTISFHFIQQNIDSLKFDSCNIWLKDHSDKCELATIDIKNNEFAIIENILRKNNVLLPDSINVFVLYLNNDLSSKHKIRFENIKAISIFHTTKNHLVHKFLCKKENEFLLLDKISKDIDVISYNCVQCIQEEFVPVTKNATRLFITNIDRPYPEAVVQIDMLTIICRNEAK